MIRKNELLAMIADSCVDFDEIANQYTSSQS